MTEISTESIQDSAGINGGKARMKNLSKEERSALAKAGAKKRWEKARAATEVEQTPPPTVAKPKKRVSKPMPKPFKSAGAYAEKRLAQAIRERAEAMGRLAFLNAEIPDLINVIRALGGNIPHGAPVLTPQLPANYNLSTIISDTPVAYTQSFPKMADPFPQQVQLPPKTKVEGGAIDGIDLGDDIAEDAFLEGSDVAGGQWH